MTSTIVIVPLKQDLIVSVAFSLTIYTSMKRFFSLVFSSRYSLIHIYSCCTSLISLLYPSLDCYSPKLSNSCVIFSMQPMSNPCKASCIAEMFYSAWSHEASISWKFSLQESMLWYFFKSISLNFLLPSASSWQKFFNTFYI
ncbi:hypothetical protein FGO68_gene13147 [Halteria grandinella]|uniref:Uncharacterized protein n=1 Tax=Halteria grandinella TaxID=5974 RepID=A0A8J8T4H2_HALGN|nr:hypothetical protein FGO68_gene13147 [Halteria grandinella]